MNLRRNRQKEEESARILEDIRKKELERGLSWARRVELFKRIEFLRRVQFLQKLEEVRTQEFERRFCFEEEFGVQLLQKKQEDKQNSEEEQD